METDLLPSTENGPPKFRWYRPTPGRFLGGLLAVEGMLVLSQRFGWFPFNHNKGWAVLIAVASVGMAMFVMFVWWLAALCFRWPFQFSLRQLFVSAVAVAVPFSWLAVEMKRAREQSDAVAEVRRLGGWLEYDYELGRLPDGTVVFCYQSIRPKVAPPGPVWLRNILGDDFFFDVAQARLAEPTVTDEDIDRVIKGLSQVRCLWLHHTQITDAGLERLKGLAQLEALAVNDTRVTDAGLEHLREIRRLEWLRLDETQVTDAGLKFLSELPDLEYLYLSHTSVTGAGLGHLKKLTRLRELDLSSTKVTDAGLVYVEGLTQLRALRLDYTSLSDVGLEHINGLTELRYLSLDHTRITHAGLEHLKGLTHLRRLDLRRTSIADAGLGHLKGLPELKELGLYETKVTEQGVKRLQQALPGCRIER